MARVEVSEVYKVFGDGEERSVALHNVSFSAEGHVFVSIVGPSGCGKSTLLNILSGIDTPSSGVASMSQDGRTAKVGYVFQDPQLLPWRTVMDNMLFVHPEHDSATRARCSEYLDLVGLADAANKFPGQLSGGMQQRVGIARAFSIEPDLLLMDEPFSHLDAITARSLRKQLHELWEATEKTILFVTHDMVEAVELSTRILILSADSRLEEDLAIDLPYPRDGADEQVAVTTADVLRVFEEMNLASH